MWSLQEVCLKCDHYRKCASCGNWLLSSLGSSVASTAGLIRLAQEGRGCWKWESFFDSPSSGAGEMPWRWFPSNAGEFLKPFVQKA